MGIAIHFSGKLKAKVGLRDLEVIGLRWAKKWKCELTAVDIPLMPMFRVIDGEIHEHEGPVKGFFLQPHQDCESVRILLDKDLRMDHFCKTQFAPSRIHVEVCSFLRDIGPLFKNFKVIDEGGYWETGDRVELERRLDFLGRMIDKVKEAFEDAEKRGPHSDYKSPDHRMN